MDDLGSALFGFDNICKTYWMGFSHIAAHNQYAITIEEILWRSCGTATTKRCTQTGHCGAVSYTGLVLNRYYTEPGIEEFFD